MNRMVREIENQRAISSDFYEELRTHASVLADGSSEGDLSKKQRFKRIGVIIEELKEIAPNNLYILKDFLHVTFKEIAFLPEKFDSSVYLDYISRINKAIKKIEPFKLQVTGINNFPNVIFAQVFSKDNKLFKFHKIMEKDFPENKSKFDYVPHVTMAQFLEKPQKLFGAIEKFNNTSFGEMIVDKIALVKCELPSKGEKFEIIKTFELAKK